ncbi:MAG: outer membrane protein assembly factor BamE [Pseudomonadota bacterium]
MSRFFLVVCLLSISFVMFGCNIVYKQNIQQGNVLDNEDIEQLEVGLTKRQVLVLLGSPAVENPFHADRWDYVNSFARRGGDAEMRHLTIEFENDQITRFYGSYLDGIEDAERLSEVIEESLEEPELPPEQPQDDPVFPEPPA